MNKPTFWKIVDSVIQKSDIVLDVLDAEHIEDTRNYEIEDKVIEKEKILIFVVNKIDTIDKVDVRGLKNYVRISTKEHIGIGKLREKIIIEAKKNGIKKPLVGVVGYPNVGKSSVINALRGRRAAKTAKKSGFTVGLQNIKGGSNIMLIDSPGVIPYGEDDDIKHITAKIKNTENIKDPIGTVIDIIKDHPGKLEEFYGIEVKDIEREEIIENIAIHKHILKKGGLPDTERMAMSILKEIYKGRLKL